MSAARLRAVLGRVLPAVRFEARRRIRARTTVLAGAAFLVAAVAGAAREAAGPGAAPAADPFPAYAWTAAALLVLRFGCGGDRRHRFDACLAGTFLPARELFAARAGVYLAASLGLGLAALGTGLLLSGSLARAGWQAAEYTLVAWLAAPAVLLVELTLGGRAPFAAVLLLYLAALLVAEPFVGAEAVVRATGFPATPFAFADLGGLAARAALAAPIGLAALYPLYRRRTRQV